MVDAPGLIAAVSGRPAVDDNMTLGGEAEAVSGSSDGAELGQSPVPEPLLAVKGISSARMWVRTVR